MAPDGAPALPALRETRMVTTSKDYDDSRLNPALLVGEARIGIRSACIYGDDAIVHYAPSDHPLCGTESLTAVFTDDPALVAGCVDCLELAAEDLVEDNEHWANCLHCQQEIFAQSGVEWRRVVRRPCPHCGKPGW